MLQPFLDFIPTALIRNLRKPTKQEKEQSNKQVDTSPKPSIQRPNPGSDSQDHSILATYDPTQWTFTQIPRLRIEIKGLARQAGVAEAGLPSSPASRRRARYNCQLILTVSSDRQDVARHEDDLLLRDSRKVILIVARSSNGHHCTIESPEPFDIALHKLLIVEDESGLRKTRISSIYRVDLTLRLVDSELIDEVLAVLLKPDQEVPLGTFGELRTSFSTVLPGADISQPLVYHWQGQHSATDFSMTIRSLMSTTAKSQLEIHKAHMRGDDAQQTKEFEFLFPDGNKSFLSKHGIDCPFCVDKDFGSFSKLRLHLEGCHPMFSFHMRQVKDNGRLKTQFEVTIPGQPPTLNLGRNRSLAALADSPSSTLQVGSQTWIQDGEWQSLRPAAESDLFRDAIETPPVKRRRLNGTFLPKSSPITVTDDGGRETPMVTRANGEERVTVGKENRPEDIINGSKDHGQQGSSISANRISAKKTIYNPDLRNDSAISKSQHSPLMIKKTSSLSSPAKHIKSVTGGLQTKNSVSKSTSVPSHVPRLQATDDGAFEKELAEKIVIDDSSSETEQRQLNITYRNIVSSPTAPHPASLNEALEARRKRAFAAAEAQRINELPKKRSHQVVVKSERPRFGTNGRDGSESSDISNCSERLTDSESVSWDKSAADRPRKRRSMVAAMKSTRSRFGINGHDGSISPDAPQLSKRLTVSESVSSDKATAGRPRKTRSMLPAMKTARLRYAIDERNRSLSPHARSPQKQPPDNSVRRESVLSDKATIDKPGDQSALASKLNKAKLDKASLDKTARNTLPEQINKGQPPPATSQRPQHIHKVAGLKEAMKKAGTLPKPSRAKLPVPAVPKGVTLFRTATKRALVEGEVLSESEDDINESWATQRHEEGIDALPNLTPDQKKFIKQWDRHFSKEQLRGTKHAPAALLRFTVANHRFLREPGMRQQLGLKMAVWYKDGIVAWSDIEKCYAVVDAKEKLRRNNSATVEQNQSTSEAAEEIPDWVMACVCGGSVGPSDGPIRISCASLNCLNPDFHMPCVGLTKRSQKWYCSKCDKEKA